jgi:hypothetical protein
MHMDANEHYRGCLLGLATSEGSLSSGDPSGNAGMAQLKKEVRVGHLHSDSSSRNWWEEVESNHPPRL